MINVLLVDDHAIVRNGIKTLISNEENITVTGEASNGEEAIEKIKELNPDVVVMDVGMPVMNGVEALIEINKQNIETKVLMLSMFDADDYVIKAVQNGALGYVLKDTEETKFIEAINTVYEGKKYFGHDISGLIIEHLMNNSSGNISSNKPNQDFDLSKRELHILQEVINGKSNKQLAEELQLSVRTIETHRLNIMKKMNAQNAIEMVKVAIQNNLA